MNWGSYWWGARTEISFLCNDSGFYESYSFLFEAIEVDSPSLGIRVTAFGKTDRQTDRVNTHPQDGV